MASTAHKDEAMLRETECTAEELEAHAVAVAELVRKAERVVFFTGAGISTTAGIPDFRGPTGVWTMAAKGQEEQAAGKAARSVPMTSAIATPTHMAIVALHRAGKVPRVISQNVDGLHRKSGIPASALSELHGNMNTEECNACGRVYYRDMHLHASQYGDHFTGRSCIAAGCNGALRDTVISFGEDLPEPALRSAIDAAAAADVMICLGSSLTVSPACDLPRLTKEKGGRVVIGNLQKTPLDAIADVRVHANVDSLMTRVCALLSIAIPQFTLERRVTLWREGTDGRVMRASGVDATADNAPVTLFQGAKLFDAERNPLQASSFACSAPLDAPLQLTLNESAVDGAHYVALEPFGHYSEPSVVLPLAGLETADGSAVSFDVTFAPGSDTAWTVRGPLTDASRPNFTRGSGPTRKDAQQRRPQPAPTAALAGATSNAIAAGVDTSGFFAVHPLAHCPHCPQVQLHPDVTLDINAPCGECGNEGENMVCLSCFEVHCGRHVQQHMLAHHDATGHPIVCGLLDLSYWCYECDSYVSERNRHIAPVNAVIVAAKFT